MAIKDYSTEPDMNTTISGINIAEGCVPSGINNAIRQLMADVKVEKDARDAELSASASAQSARDSQQDAAISAAIVSAVIDGLDLVITYGNGTTERVKLPTGKGVGDLWTGHDPKSVPANVQLYSGQLLSRAAYEAHSALVLGGKRTVVTEAEWQAMVAAQGFCPWYSSGDGSTTYRMPLIQGVHPKFVAALAEAGQYIEAGAPNIKGTSGVARYASWANEDGASGALYHEVKTGTMDNGENVSYTLAYLAIDASRSSSVYRDDIDTVQPEALTFLIGEYVVGSVAVLGEADAESLLASVTTLESNVGALESGVGRARAYIVETWHEGAEWYRKWSDGWVEQGGNNLGKAVATSQTITFNIPFTAEPKTLVTTCGGYSGTGAWSAGIKTGSVTSTSFIYLGPGNGKVPTNGMSWYACGY